MLFYALEQREASIFDVVLAGDLKNKSFAELLEKVRVAPFAQSYTAIGG